MSDPKDPKTAPTPCPEWSVEDVVVWAGRFIDAEDAECLRKAKVKGNYLLTLNQNYLITVIGLPPGAAYDLSQQLNPPPRTTETTAVLLFDEFQILESCEFKTDFLLQLKNIMDSRQGENLYIHAVVGFGTYTLNYLTVAKTLSISPFPKDRVIFVQPLPRLGVANLLKSWASSINAIFPENILEDIVNTIGGYAGLLGMLGIELEAVVPEKIRLYELPNNTINVDTWIQVRSQLLIAVSSKTDQFSRLVKKIIEDQYCQATMFQALFCQGEKPLFFDQMGLGYLSSAITLNDSGALSYNRETGYTISSPLLREYFIMELYKVEKPPLIADDWSSDITTFVCTLVNGLDPKPFRAPEVYNLTTNFPSEAIFHAEMYATIGACLYRKYGKLLQHTIISEGSMGDYIENKRFADVKLICGDVTYETHRIILAYSSEYFARLLCSEFRESSQAQIELRQPDPYGVFPAVLAFMYDGRVQLSPENVIAVLAMADHYLIKALHTLCLSYLDTNLHRENVLTILRTSIDFHFDTLVDKCISILAKNFPYVCESGACEQSPGSCFTFLPPNTFLDLLKHQYLVVKNEYALYLIVTSFIRANLQVDSDATAELMSQIRYIWMTYEQLIEISSNPLVPKDILIETFMERLKKYEHHDTSLEPPVNHSRFLPRPPQSILFEYNHDFDNKGILYWISSSGLKDKWTNPHTASKIKITSSSIDKGNHFDIVELVPMEFWTKDVPASWVTIDLGSNRSVIPMYYTIRHGLPFKSDSLRTWDFQGSVQGEQWTVLKRHTNDSSLNSKYATHTWQIQGVTTAYRYFRILQTGKNSNNRNFLVLGGIELYGELLQR
eukprot:gene15822-18802_t